MGVQERVYMSGEPDQEIDIGQIEGVEARNQQYAEKLLKFACPTRCADGRWYRVTIAVTNVPVRELYNVLSNMNFIAAQIREIVADAPSGLKADIEKKATQIEGLHQLLRQMDRGSKVIDNLHVHSPKGNKCQT